jgi:hypothetical protein
MTSTDPETIQRILFLSSSVHVYAIPPLTSTKGYTAADWTVPDPRNGNKTRQIFTARLRILESSPVDSDFSSASTSASPKNVKIDVLLEDPTSGDLFAGAPYTDPGAVEQVLDSARFFVLRVVSPEDGRRAMLGIGFEERAEAFDFLVGLEEGRKVLGFGNDGGGSGKGKDAGKKAKKDEEKDFSLKPGERIKVEIGRKGERRVVRKEEEAVRSPETERREDERALFSIAPPPPPAGGDAEAFRIAPPPGSAGGSGSGAGRRRRPQSGIMSNGVEQLKELEEKKKREEELGFDDGEFGEFQ